VSLERIVFGYDRGRPVLRGVDLAVNAGETVALVGPTGAGKSTLVSLIPRLFDPWEGVVRLNGVDVRDASLDEVRRNVGFVLQDSFLLPVSIAENIAYGRPGASREEVVAAAAAARADEFIRKLADGYDTVIGERGATLSGGQRQRLSIARALLKDAPILILDEPTSALDVETESLLMEAVERLTEDRTTIVIAHRLSTIRAADKVVILKDGQLAQTSVREALMAQATLYAQDGGDK
jgi:ATP-binding cassette, subfamily B, bacterial